MSTHSSRWSKAFRRTAGRVEVRVHQVVRNPEGDVLSDGYVQHAYTLRDGLVARMDIEPA